MFGLGSLSFFFGHFSCFVLKYLVVFRFPLVHPRGLDFFYFFQICKIKNRRILLEEMRDPPNPFFSQ